MSQERDSRGKTTVAFDGKLLAVDKALWSANGGVWHTTTKLHELQPAARNKLGLGASVRAWLALTTDPGLGAKVMDWLVDLAETPPEPERKNEPIGVIATSEARIYLLTGWYSLVKIESVPFVEGGAQEAVLGAILAGAKAPMALALVARRSPWVGAGIDHVNVESGDFGTLQFDLRVSEQKL